MKNDFAAALRSLLKAPGFTLAATLTLALGVGANTAIFSVINHVLLRPLPYPEPDRLVMLWEHNTRRSYPMNVVSPANFLDWRERSRSFEAVAGFFDRSFTLTGAGDPEEVRATAVTANFFTILGGTAKLGRALNPEDEKPESPLTVVLSHRYWQERFGGDPAVIGRTLNLSGSSASVVGVMSEEFGFYVKEASFNQAPPSFWVQARFDASHRVRRGRYMSAIGRLKDGVPLDQARTEMATIASSLEQQYQSFNKDWTVNLVPLREQTAGGIRPALLAIFGAVCLTLFIACANVANLQLVRASARSREFTVRAALGASQGQLARFLLAESLILSLTGGFLGLGLARSAMAGLHALMPQNLLPGGGIALEPRVLAFTLVTAVATGLVFGLIPALVASRPRLVEALREGGRGLTSARGRRLRQSFVTAQVALALVVLIGAGLLGRSFEALISTEVGFDASHLLTARINLPAASYPDPAKIQGFYEQLIGSVRSMPGVIAVSGNVFAPFAGPGAGTSFEVVGKPAPTGQAPVTDVRIVAADYFTALQIPLRQGRDFAPEEQTARRDVVIINETLARRHFSDRSPLGEKLVINMRGDQNTPSTIVGVVGDIRHQSLDTPAREMVYWPHSELPLASMTLLIRTAQSPLQVAPALQRAVWALDRNIPVAEPKAMEELVAGTAAQARFATLLFGLFAALALALAALGLYGVISYKVSLETRDIGVRMAMGANRGVVLRAVLGDGGRLAALGIVVGLGGAMALTRLLESQLYGVTATDPLTFVVIPAFLLLVAIAACLPAALRAARLDPMIALRDE